MYKPTELQCLYLDFDGFFASVEQQIRPRLRGKPVGVTPFAGNGNRCLIACSKEAKAFGVKNVSTLEEARAICPDIILVPQSPDMYRRAQNALCSEIESVVPIAAIKSIDELVCDLDETQAQIPEHIAEQIKLAVRNLGEHITCSIGFAANRQLAKIACKMDKPDGVTIWHPRDMPAPLFKCSFDDVPGIGSRMEARLLKAGITTVEEFYNADPKHMRKLWRNVTGERLWYALHGYDVKAPESKRGMFGHGRVLPPESRPLAETKRVCTLLLTKAARRLRREGFYTAGLYLGVSLRNRQFSRSITLPVVHDDQAVLAGFRSLWAELEKVTRPGELAYRANVFLYDLSPANTRQLDFLLEDDWKRQGWERICSAMDSLNEKYGKTAVCLGPLPKTTDNVGGKISYTRIPSAEDFW